MITRIEAYGYRCFPSLSVDLDRYQVLAGSNGAGKTTFLDIPTLLGDLQGRLAEAAFLERPNKSKPARAGSLVELLHKRRGESFAFAVEARLPDEIVEALAERSFSPLVPYAPTHLRYELVLAVEEQTLSISAEYLFLFSEHGRRPAQGEVPQGHSAELGPGEWQSVIHREGSLPTKFTPEATTQATDIPPLRVPGGQLALGAVPADPTLFPSALWFAELLREGVVFFDPDWDHLRQPAPPGERKRLLPSGRNAPWLALTLSRQDPGRFARWVDHVQSALPQVANIRVIEREEDHYAYFSVEYGGGYRVTSSGLSDGTLRILALTLLPYLDEATLPRLLVTEEPENGIHPRAIETITDSLSSLYDSQVWVSTHSPIVLAHTDLSDLLIARLNKDGSVSVVPGDEHPRLREWKGNLDIGTLFAAGVLS
ncbi:methylation-associated defense system AAA family ATPase MAD3 [Actinomadura verrucosospora]|uniref:methylation-associated defense system AAA family ATPase MAD3 n=1 Tax=Actinomadura verrucosospora TaxID=46165 RepID=UPI0015679AF4|nr:AAA family ATPase [Actinomadura verrucosospora]